MAEARLDAALAIADGFAEKWNVALDGWLPGGTCSLVLTGVWQGQEVVLRCPLLDWERAASLRALRAFSEHGGIQILLSDRATGVALMPHLRPATDLATLPEDEAIDACAALILRLREAEGDAPNLETYGKKLLTLPKPKGLRLASDVPALFRRLLESSPAPRFMHGDLHHFNVLRHGESWVAIDPEGIVGDPAYETAAFLRNPVPTIADILDLPDLLKSRIFRFAELLGDPAERIWGWALVRTATCVWTDGSSFQAAWVRVVEALDALRDEFAPSLEKRS